MKARISPIWKALLRDKRARARREVRRIIRGYQPERAILFGSIARGDVHVGSDVDLLLIKENPEPRFIDRISSALRHTAGEIGVEVFVYTPTEIRELKRCGNDFLRTVLREGKVVYERPKPKRRRKVARARRV